MSLLGSRDPMRVRRGQPFGRQVVRDRALVPESMSAAVLIVARAHIFRRDGRELAEGKGRSGADA